ncbi:hypothetical protein AcW1_006350 [Taiwanofungus camphoratus]|nr:hypothetical protein AcV5_008939 [Antrodia cinnamomea]KAI0924153.1 hypothetical protein AcW2_005115 [Antrodia cinnamomea]KAI0940997.1 hypothetical protein AcV7_003221 [Antrodia cinnamomea]KAI0954461.1 hypothetical protein AcW1_006350 [Antrodia cinnamomea]
MPAPIRRVFAQTRRASSSSLHSFPFPTNAHPTPHQIFHLPIGASQRDIKARYYDLVRVHHPDSPFCRDLSHAERHARFQSLTAAYDALRGRNVDPIRAELDRRRRAQEARHRHSRRAEFAGGRFDYAHGPRQQEWSASPDDRWKDRFIIAAGLLSLGAGLAPALIWPSIGVADQRHLVASSNLAQARQEAREFGRERRAKIRRRVRETKQRSCEELDDEAVRPDGPCRRGSHRH